MSNPVDPVEAATFVFVARGVGSERSRLTIDGHDLTRFTRAITFHAEAGEINRAIVTFVASEGFALALPIGLAAIEMRVAPGYRLIREHVGDRDVWRSEKEEP